MSIATLSSKHQITVPKLVRERLGLRQGQKVVIEIGSRNFAVLKPVESAARHYEGLGAETWRRLGGARFVKRERSSWRATGRLA